MSTCNSDASCIGFIATGWPEDVNMYSARNTPPEGISCYIYERQNVPALMNIPVPFLKGAEQEFFQKPDTGIIPAPPPPPSVLPPSNYTRHPLQIPVDRNNFTKTLHGGANCVAGCNADGSCVGFTAVGMWPNITCYLYESPHKLFNYPDAD